MKEFINSTTFALISMALCYASILIEILCLDSDLYPGWVQIVIHTISGIMGVLGLTGCLTVVITCITNGTV